MSNPNGVYLAAEIKKICMDAGADDVGLVDLDRDSLNGEREGILHVYDLVQKAAPTDHIVFLQEETVAGKTCKERRKTWPKLVLSPAKSWNSSSPTC